MRAEVSALHLRPGRLPGPTLFQRRGSRAAGFAAATLVLLALSHAPLRAQEALFSALTIRGGGSYDVDRNVIREY
ncbi:MAG TPA: hypothetical protein VMN39_12825 [Longimicrobiaceae bacterium]|nr:hypothetical protein [Longimicrobiaceae bacterium]